VDVVCSKSVLLSKVSVDELLSPETIAERTEHTRAATARTLAFFDVPALNEFSTLRTDLTRGAMATESAGVGEAPVAFVALVLKQKDLIT